MNSLCLKLGLAVAIGRGVGAVVGVKYARHTVGSSEARMSQWAAVGDHAALAHLQYRYADEAHARAAEPDFVSFAQQAKTSGKVSDGKTFSLDVAYAYVRLAGLDRRDGNMEGYKANRSRAKEAVREFGGRDSLVDDNINRFLTQDEPQPLEIPKWK